MAGKERMQQAREAKNYVAGHRERLRARYRLSGEVALQDYELLELLLTYAIPRRDTKLLAKRLLERFGTLARVVEAEPAALEAIDGMGPQAATLISLIRPLATRFLTEAPAPKILLRSTGDAEAYFQAKLKGLPEEEVHVAFVNSKNAVTATECLQRGTVDQSVVYVRKVIERALVHKASGFLLAHNHPSGDPTPSPQDREITQALKTAAATVGVRFLDHLVIGDGAPFSFKAVGLL
ncbi:MAG: DNA repair protein RadC [Candidatus Methylomirabilis oxygeniifera]|uniref:DNA repair protein radC homolog n=1 Tax=Methylomirabilis oxygeniifera TaxID=671143 RepID=D5MHR8_METO1|nr:MAG: DNA repair protein RadC [Candidatus Methylomirabilis oxyfera]CBE67201.1 DNA repair protein radC homolog [Candidatus Methylomirabilis oxyfera]